MKRRKLKSFVLPTLYLLITITIFVGVIFMGRDIALTNKDYDSYLNKYIYFVPVYFRVTYYTNSSSTKTVLDTESNAYKYNYTSRRYAYSDTINYYRYINGYVDYSNTKWSTSRYLSGYQFTGNVKYM